MLNVWDDSQPVVLRSISICYRPRRGINVKYIWENCAKSTERKFRASTILRAYNSQEICRPKKCEIIRKNDQIILREVLCRFYALSLSVLMFKLITKIYWFIGWVGSLKKQPWLVLYEIILCIIKSKKLTSPFRESKQNCDSNRCKFACNFSLTSKTQTTLTELRTYSSRLHKSFTNESINYRSFVRCKRSTNDF